MIIIAFTPKTRNNLVIGDRKFPLQILAIIFFDLENVDKDLLLSVPSSLVGGA